MTRLLFEQSLDHGGVNSCWEEWGLIDAYVQNTLDEAEGAIERAARRTGVSLLRPFRDAMQMSRLVVLPRIYRYEGRTFTAIRGAGDKALAAAAAKISANICTNDLKDFKHSDRYGFKVCTPEQLTDDGSVSLSSVVPGIVATPHQGTFYVEIARLNWADVAFASDSTEAFYLFDAEGIGACYFEASSRSFIVILDGGPRLSLYYGIVCSDSIPLKIVVTYDFTSGVVIFVGTAANLACTSSWRSLPVSADMRAWIGCDRRGANQISGCIRRVYAVPYKVGERAVRNMINSVTVNNPWERLALEDVIKLFILGD